MNLPCRAQQFSDEMVCFHCGLRWDVNDPMPPECSPQPNGKTPKRVLEKDIEREVCSYARSKGWLTYKFSSPNRAAVPDRLFILPEGDVIFVEFKRSGEVPTPAQLREHGRLTGQHCTVWVIDTITEGKKMVDRYAHS